MSEFYSLGCGYVTIGAFNIIHYRTCTTKFTAIYLYSRITGKSANNAVTISRYNWDGEEYTYAAKQQVSASLIGAKYRKDQP